MSNTRKLQPSLLQRRTLYHCAVCRKKFHSPADRDGHYKWVPGGRICAPTQIMQRVLGYRLRRGAWYRATERPSPAGL